MFERRVPADRSGRFLDASPGDTPFEHMFDLKVLPV